MCSRLSRLLLSCLVACWLAIVTIETAAAQKIGDLKVVAREGAWELRYGKDNFSDKTTCVIVLSSDAAIQVSPGSFYINYRGRGGLDGFRYRLDDAPESGMQLPTRIQKQTSMIIFEGITFERILNATRLRVQTLTLVAGLKNEDINLRGLASLYQRMDEFCGSAKSSAKTTQQLPPRTSSSKAENKMAPSTKVGDPWSILPGR
jgi:hypothetical protein